MKKKRTAAELARKLKISPKKLRKDIRAAGYRKQKAHPVPGDEKLKPLT